MKVNMGSVDRIIRIAIAIVILILYVTEIISGTTAILLLVMSSILIVTSLLKVCPLYLPFGISTDKSSKQDN